MKTEAGITLKRYHNDRIIAQKGDMIPQIREALLGEGIVCIPNNSDMKNWPNTLAIVFFEEPIEKHIAQVDLDDENNLTYAGKVPLGGFLYMKPKERLFFGPDMKTPFVPEYLVINSPKDLKNQDLPNKNPLTPLEKQIIENYEENVEEHDEAMRAKRHYGNNRSDFLTSNCMPSESLSDDTMKIAIPGDLLYFLVKDDEKNPYAMVFEIGKPKEHEPILYSPNTIFPEKFVPEEVDKVAVPGKFLHFYTRAGEEEPYAMVFEISYVDKKVETTYTHAQILKLSPEEMTELMKTHYVETDNPTSIETE